MKKTALLLALILALLPTVALAISDASFQFNNKWYGFEYDKAEFDGGYLVVWVTCPDGLPIVDGLPTVPVTAAIDGGFLNGKADGDFGNMTDAAVKAAQEAFGLEANGIADDAFQRRLYGE